MKSRLGLLVFLFALVAAQAEPLTRDLGQGLAYYRIHRLPADLPTAETARRQPCVLDLRYVRAEAEAASALAGWMKFHATARTPVFILANAETSLALLTPLTSRTSSASVVILGPVSAGFTPDIALKISPDAERRAYDALEQGASVAALLNDSPDKARNDEARLARDQRGDAAPDDEAASRESKPAPPAPVIDAALQRAVQLHRTLLALKRLGE
jgi:hypothetical protein